MNLVIPEKPQVGASVTVSDLHQIHGLAEGLQPAAPQVRDPFLRQKLASLRSYLQFQPSDFEVLCLLGEGSVGHVYLVKRSGPDVIIPSGRDEVVFALKVCSQHDLARRSKTRRFLEERDILIASHHPYVMTLHATFADERNFYLLMEFCNGGEFAELLRRQPGHRLPEPIVRFYAAELVSALEYLHFYNIIYRDLKTENVLLHSDGHIRLTDFDLAKRMDMAKAVSEVAFLPTEPGGGRGHGRGPGGAGMVPLLLPREDTTNSLVGTPEYLPPEVIRGDHSQAADWWTLGIFIFECLYGHTPFFTKGVSAESLQKRILRGLFTFPDEPRRISRHAKSLIMGLLETDPRKRLGGKYGAAEIKSHPWFHGINFAFVGEAPRLPNYVLRNPIGAGGGGASGPGRARRGSAPGSAGSGPAASGSAASGSAASAGFGSTSSAASASPASGTGSASTPAPAATPSKARRKGAQPEAPAGGADPPFNAQYYKLTPEDLKAVRENFPRHKNEDRIIACDMAGTGFRLPASAQRYVPLALQAYQKAGLPTHPKPIDIYGEEIARLVREGKISNPAPPEPVRPRKAEDEFEGVRHGSLIRKGALTIQPGDAAAARLQDQAIIAARASPAGSVQVPARAEPAHGAPPPAGAPASSRLAASAAGAAEPEDPETSGEPAAPAPGRRQRGSQG